MSTETETSTVVGTFRWNRGSRPCDEDGVRRYPEFLAIAHHCRHHPHCSPLPCSPEPRRRYHSRPRPHRQCANLPVGLPLIFDVSTRQGHCDPPPHCRPPFAVITSFVSRSMSVCEFEVLSFLRIDRCPEPQHLKRRFHDANRALAGTGLNTRQCPRHRYSREKRERKKPLVCA